MTIIPDLFYDGVDEDYDIDEWDEDDENEMRDEYETCSCPYCNCMNETEYGEVCSECLHGTHQGQVMTMILPVGTLIIYNSTKGDWMLGFIRPRKVTYIIGYVIG